MNNKEEDRPGIKGENNNTIQCVHIGFIGIKCCGKDVIMDGGPHEP